MIFCDFGPKYHDLFFFGQLDGQRLSNKNGQIRMALAATFSSSNHPVLQKLREKSLH